MQKCFKDIEECLLRNCRFQGEFGHENRAQYALKKYGSSVNGLMSTDSDLDLTLIISETKKGHEEILQLVKAALLAEGGRYLFDSSMPMLIKPGWILRLRDASLNISIDIMVNKTSEVLHSMLILQYSLIDQRFLKIVQILKHWNSHLSERKSKRLNNFSLYLMLIAFMQ